MGEKHLPHVIPKSEAQISFWMDILRNVLIDKPWVMSACGTFQIEYIWCPFPLYDHSSDNSFENLLTI